MKLLRQVLRLFGYLMLSIFVLAILLIAIGVAPVDRTPVQHSMAYEQTMANIRSFSPQFNHGKFRTGFARVNITPDEPMPTAGYGNRLGRDFSVVRDSIYVRTIVVGNHEKRVAIVSADLLIIPPTLMNALDRKLNATGFSIEDIFISATHSHNSVGCWSDGAMEFIYGDYDPLVVEGIADAIIQSITEASGDLKTSQFFTGKIEMPELVSNRLIKGGNEDPFFRFVKIVREDSIDALMMNFSAHATCLKAKDYSLSADYPGELVKQMESTGFEFAMFMAGGVGSHSCNAPSRGPSCIEWMADKIVTTFHSATPQITEISDSTLVIATLPFALPEPQAKLTEDLKIRAWLFRSALNEVPVHLSVLKIGEATFIGTPCDFSGEFNSHLDSVASANGQSLFVSSFNGGYIGYVTPEKYYDKNHFETRLMSWYGVGMGEYMVEAIDKLIVALR